MAELKTQKTNASVAGYLDAIDDKARQTDCKKVAQLMEKITGAKGRMWGSSIVGFGEFSYVGKSGRSGDWFQCGFSSRKQNLTLYLMGGLGNHTALLGKLGKHTLGKGCLYVNRLADIDLHILEKLIVANLAGVNQWADSMKDAVARKKAAAKKQAKKTAPKKATAKKAVKKPVKQAPKKKK